MLSALTIGDTLISETADGRVRASSMLTGLDESIELWVDVDRSLRRYITELADPWVPAGALLAMHRGLALRAEARVSAPLEKSIHEVSSLLHAWFPNELHRVEPQVRVASRSRWGWLSCGGTSAMCFTGGVDSFYSLLSADPRPRILVNVAGVDISRARPELELDTRRRLLGVAEAYGTGLVSLRSNIRSVLLQHGLRWGCHAHGSVLAGFGHLLSGYLDSLIVAATHNAASVRPWGSHPQLDPLWSSDRMTVIHHGFEASRVEKTRMIATDPVALRSLRVCLKYNSDANCGRCAKCVRTMVTLAFLGALDKHARFPLPLLPKHLAPFAFVEEHNVQHMLSAIELGRSTGCRPDLIPALEGVVERSRDAQRAAERSGPSPSLQKQKRGT